MFSSQTIKDYRLALITGASSGLGKALSHFLAEKNIPLLLTARSLEKVEGAHIAVKVDLNNRQERTQLLELISEKMPDLIINNAGLGLYGNCHELDPHDLLEMIEVNIAALVEISVHASKTLNKTKKQGTILNISSAGAFFAYPSFNVYCATKSFVNQFSKALRAELKIHGIQVLTACPGQIATNFRSKAAKGYPQKCDFRTMEVHTAVRHLWKQIQTGKPLTIFDWKTSLLVFLARLIPDFLLNPLLLKGIRSRISD